MALKIGFLAALCVAQVFAFQPIPDVFPRDVVCDNTADDIAHNFEEVVNGIDDVRETVSMAALDAYAKGNSNIEVILACFKVQRDSYRALGERISGMVRDASEKMAQELGSRAEKYAKLMEVPLRTIAVTMRALPERVYKLMSELRFVEAMEAIMEARRIVEDNSRIVGQLMQQMVSEVPEMANEARQMAEEIGKEARMGAEAIRKAFRKCVEEGGPKKITAEE